MEIAVTFATHFAIALFYVSPVLSLLILLIVGLGSVVRRQEQWAWSEALYFAFVTATTVGYGDRVPSTALSCATAIVIALVGLVMTGIIVAVGLHSLELALTEVLLTDS